MGGTVYLGIHDSGNVFGLRLTLAQMDHLQGSITDTLSRFRPRVDPALVKINFVPVLKRDQQSPNWSDELKKWCIAERQKLDLDEETPHKRRRPLASCWCERQAGKKYE